MDPSSILRDRKPINLSEPQPFICKNLEFNELYTGLLWRWNEVCKSTIRCQLINCFSLLQPTQSNVFSHYYFSTSLFHLSSYNGGDVWATPSSAQGSLLEGIRGQGLGCKRLTQVGHMHCDISLTLSFVTQFALLVPPTSFLLSSFLPLDYSKFSLCDLVLFLYLFIYSSLTAILSTWFLFLISCILKEIASINWIQTFLWFSLSAFRCLADINSGVTAHLKWFLLLSEEK